MASPISFFLAVKVIVSDFPENVKSWEEYFSANFRWFFLAVFCAWLASRIRQYYFFDEIPSISGLLFGGVLIIGVAIYKRIVHFAIVGYMFYFSVVGAIARAGT